MIMPCGEAGIFGADISCLYRHISVRHIAAQPVADTAFISPLHAVIYFDNIGGAVLLFAAVAHMYIVECSAYSCKNIIPCRAKARLRIFAYSATKLCSKIRTHFL